MLGLSPSGPLLWNSADKYRRVSVQMASRDGVSDVRSRSGPEVKLTGRQRVLSEGEKDELTVLTK